MYNCTLAQALVHVGNSYGYYRYIILYYFRQHNNDKSKQRNYTSQTYGENYENPKKIN